VTARSGRELDRAAIDLSAVISDGVTAAVLGSSLATSLREFRTVDDLVAIHGLHRDKQAALEAIVGILVERGRLEPAAGTPGAWRLTDRAATGPPDVSRTPSLDRWFTGRHVDLVRRSQQAFLGRDLDFLRTRDGRLGFDRHSAPAWRINLADPLYDFGRAFAVRALAAPGGRYLDLASGLGYGTRRLAEWCDWQCEILCVDKSADFLDEARQLIYPPGTRVVHVHRDLNTGLPPVRRDSVDGVLFVGAFHYIDDKPRVLRQVWDALRPGGRLVIGHCVVATDKPDRAAQQYMFAVTTERAHVVPLRDLRAMLARTGFTEVEELHRGSQYSVVVAKPAHSAADDR
jgi:SAM-dependent methyltransferase